MYTYVRTYICTMYTHSHMMMNEEGTNERTTVYININRLNIIHMNKEKKNVEWRVIIENEKKIFHLKTPPKKA